MSKVLIENDTLLNIANSIRIQSENYVDMLPSEMSSHILDIDTEKVFIDGYKAENSLSLYGFQNQVTLDINTIPTNISGTRYRLPDGRDLYLSNASSSGMVSGTVKLVRNNTVLYTLNLPAYTIPSTSQSGETAYGGTTYYYNISITNSGKVFLAIKRQYNSDENPNSVNDNFYYTYLSCYQLNVYSNSLSWTKKFLEVPAGSEGVGTFGSPFAVVTDYGLYTVVSDGYTDSHAISFRAFSSNINALEVVSGYDGSSSWSSNDITKLFINNNGQDVCHYNSRRGIITATRNSDGTHTKGEKKSFSMISTSNKRTTWFDYLGNQYIMSLGSSSSYAGLIFYKVNSTNTGFDNVLTFSTTATYRTHSVKLPSHGMPEQIFVGVESSYYGYPIVRSDGTFELYIFDNGSFNYSQLITPTVNNAFGYYIDEWVLYKFIYNEMNQKVFFFSVEAPQYGYDGYYPTTRYKCVLEAMDGSPVLYSTFKENDLIN